MTKTEVERLAVLETDMKYVKDAVTNHIPTAISDLDKKIDRINLRLAYASGAIAIVVVLAQLAFSQWGG